MAQFDVHRSPGGNRTDIPYVVVVQSGRLDHLPTRLVVPLAALGSPGRDEPRMMPAFVVEGRRVVLVPWQIQTIRTVLLGPVIASFANDHAASQIVHALDLVTSRAYG
jgi:toxin CcdB